MKQLFFLVLLVFGLHFGIAQISVQDSVSGGSYSIKSISKLDSLVLNTVKAKCNRPGPDIGKNDDPIEPLDPCSKSPKVMGYKIQIMYTKDRNVANRAQAEFARNFPSLVPEMIYTRPDYKVMAGDYFTKRSAASDLNKVKKKYPGAFLVNWRIWCRKAK